MAHRSDDKKSALLTLLSLSDGQVNDLEKEALYGRVHDAYEGEHEGFKRIFRTGMR